MPRRFARLRLQPLYSDIDGERVVLDDAGHPLFDELLFGSRRPIYLAFDLLVDGGVDLRLLPLKERKASLARIGKGAERWIALTDPDDQIERTLFAEMSLDKARAVFASYANHRPRRG